MTGTAAIGMVTTPVTARGRRTRAALVAAARAVFEERGFAATRMSDVAAAAGVSHGTVYTWFDSKSDLLQAVTADTVARVQAAGPDEAPGVDPYQRLLAANRRFFAAFQANARMLAVVEEAASADPRWAAVLDGVRQSYVDRAQRTLRRLQQQRLVAPDVDPPLAATALTGMAESMARRYPVPERGDEHVAEHVTRLWARAVGLAVPAADTREPREGAQ